MNSPRLAAALCVALVATLSACAPVGSESEQLLPDVPAAYPVFRDYPEIEMATDVDYGAASAGSRLDVCIPDTPTIPGMDAGETVDEDAPTEASPAVIVVHGGSWARGDKADIAWRSVCQWLASEGFVTFSVNYALAPEHPFPAGVDDVRRAVEWMRDDEQVARFAIDPDRIGAFGGSAGGNLVAMLGLEGEGDLTTGSRVAAVVELSGPVDLTTAGFSLGGVTPTFRNIQLSYLGCADYASCPQARDASPLYKVDPSDPPFFVGHSLDEMIPREQSDALVESLRENGIAVDYVTAAGTLHSIAMLDEELRERIAAWLRVQLS